MYKKILIPSDGSEYAMRAAEYALEVAKENPAVEITIVYAYQLVPDLALDTPFTPSIITFADEQAQAILEKTAKVFEDAGIKAETVVRRGDPGREIAELAREGGFDHIIMGTRGAGALGGLIFGSVAQKVVQLAPCPVLLVK
ncbi:MAG: universal stress protein [Thermoanaerobacterales bacterium]|nr:universal stress protein [Thermoanaerobacterales bacterium]